MHVVCSQNFHPFIFPFSISALFVRMDCALKENCYIFKLSFNQNVASDSVELTKERTAT